MTIIINRKFAEDVHAYLISKEKTPDPAQRVRCALRNAKQGLSQYITVKSFSPN